MKVTHQLTPNQWTALEVAAGKALHSDVVKDSAERVFVRAGSGITEARGCERVAIAFEPKSVASTAEPRGKSAPTPGRSTVLGAALSAARAAEAEDVQETAGALATRLVRDKRSKSTPPAPTPPAPPPAARRSTSAVARVAMAAAESAVVDFERESA